ncbi:hypothetical protein PIB30_054949 [Stylosanthes scabra]|uniref:Ubiquitin-like protease family profile domain-containing protein n=1 Tax=Stylosanthes scabra TaxID=79078 RepID=A0ABU6QJC9_9FABA|nr:hypothetical protein [Stylosanthes scabra]
MLEDLRAKEPIDDSENLETLVKEETEEPKTPRKRLYKWATEGEEDIMYEFLFKFMTGKTFEAVREHFMSLAKEAEMDLANKLSTLIISMDSGLILLIIQLFAPVLYSHHWWLYVLDVEKKKFYVLDLLNPKTTGSSERMKLNRFASNILDQMMVYAGAETMFPSPITTQVASHSLLPKYIRVPKQTNQ